MYKNPKNQIRYWLKWMVQDPHRREDFWYNVEELKYVIKNKFVNKSNPLCWVGMHNLEKSYTWYYEPDWYCTRCDEQDVKNLRWRYMDWAVYHTMNPLAWPFVIYVGISSWWYDKTHGE